MPKRAIPVVLKQEERAALLRLTTLEFWLSTTRNVQAAKRFFAKALHASHTVTPRVITR